MVIKSVVKYIDNSMKKSKSFIDEIYDLFSFSTLLSIFLTLLKIFFISIFICISSFFICVFIHSIFVPYQNKTLTLDFHYDNERSYMVSSIYFNCTQDTVNEYTQCGELDLARYSIILNLDVANRVHTQDSRNIEIELLFHTRGNRVISNKKVFFFEKMEFFTDLILRMILLPFRLFGFFKNRILSIKLMDNYNNKINPIKKLDVVMKSRELNLYNADIIFIPKNNIITKIYGKLKLFILPISFGISFAIQFVIVLIGIVISKMIISHFKKD